VSETGAIGRIADILNVTPYLCKDRTSSAWSGVVGVELLCAPAVRAHGWRDGSCARAPSLTSVHGPGWLRAGDMMFDGVIPLGGSVAAARSFWAVQQLMAGRSLSGAGRGASV